MWKEKEWGWVLEIQRKEEGGKKAALGEADWQRSNVVQVTWPPSRFLYVNSLWQRFIRSLQIVYLGSERSRSLYFKCWVSQLQLISYLNKGIWMEMSTGNVALKVLSDFIGSCKLQSLQITWSRPPKAGFHSGCQAYMILAILYFLKLKFHFNSIYMSKASHLWKMSLFSISNLKRLIKKLHLLIKWISHWPKPELSNPCFFHAFGTLLNLSRSIIISYGGDYDWFYVLHSLAALR